MKELDINNVYKINEIYSNIAKWRHQNVEKSRLRK